MEIPRTVLSKSVRSMQTSARTGTHLVTGDALDTPFAPATATLDVSTSSSLPPISEADFDVSNLSINTPVAPLAEAAVAPTAVLAAATAPTTVAVASTSSPQMRPGPSNQPGRPQTYREFCEKTSRSMAACYRSLEDSDAEDAMHAPPTPLAEDLPEPASSSNIIGPEVSHSSAEAFRFPHFSAEASNSTRFSASNDADSLRVASDFIRRRIRATTTITKEMMLKKRKREKRLNSQDRTPGTETDRSRTQRKGSMKYPKEHPVALKYLAAPATSASFERCFSHAGLAVVGKKNRTQEGLLDDKLIYHLNESISC
ncbi:hypothetical protein AAVH_19385 [Aphelenchoides avenae]|nr:hypothetical protein AAVH_19385 [Aphelenchus avenae]